MTLRLGIISWQTLRQTLLRAQDGCIYGDVRSLKSLRSFYGSRAGIASLRNRMRAARGLSNSTTCPRCGQVSETSSHRLRDCPKSLEVRDVLVDQVQGRHFFNANIANWVDMNINPTIMKIGRQCFLLLTGSFGGSKL